ncbi:MAG: rRNA maturation RNase YbeY [Thermoanaerobacteraceae bacterium]|nr:rRNA maturation RNase YbeY [Thermoanaerobacteraceae bacterium]
MEVSIHNQQDKIVWQDRWQDLLERVARQVAEQEQLDPRAELSIILVDNEIIKDINSRYRGIDAPTDVISFALNDQSEEEVPLHPGADWMLGDIYISVEKAREQSEEYGHSFERELAFLAVHGILHLLGYNHDTEQKRKGMRLKEEGVLAALNLVR